MTVAQLTNMNPPRSHRHSNFSKDAYYSKPTTMVVTHIYTPLSLSASLCLSLSKTPYSPSWNKRQTSTPFPLTSFGILPDFFTNSTLSALFVLRTTCRLEIGFHWIHRTLGELLETFGHLLLFLFLLAKPGLDWIGLDSTSATWTLTFWHLY